MHFFFFKKTNFYLFCLRANLVQNNPVGVNLGVALGVQHHRLIGPEVRQGNLGVLGTVVDPVDHFILVEVRLTNVSDAVV